jgi:hypothetical protein
MMALLVNSQLLQQATSWTDKRESSAISMGFVARGPETL